MHLYIESKKQMSNMCKLYNMCLLMFSCMLYTHKALQFTLFVVLWHGFTEVLNA